MEIQMAGRKGFVYRSGVKKGPTINFMNYNRSLNEVVQLQMKKNPQTDKDYRTYVRADALKVDNEENPTKGIALGAEWNVRGGAGDQHWVLGRLKDQEEVNILGKVSNKEDGYDWYEIKYNRTWVNASPYDIGYYVNPDKFPSATKGYYQFLKLSGSASAPAMPRTPGARTRGTRRLRAGPEARRRRRGTGARTGWASRSPRQTSRCREGRAAWAHRSPIGVAQGRSSRARAGWTAFAAQYHEPSTEESLDHIHRTRRPRAHHRGPRRRGHHRRLPHPGAGASHRPWRAGISSARPARPAPARRWASACRC